LISVLKTRPGILRMLDYAFASIFGAFAIRILTTSR
jgi:threonine/homoserine/homoserine lactone efflux protein